MKQKIPPGVFSHKEMDMYKIDTIAAISTPPGTGGISCIRISGENAFESVVVFPNSIIRN